jgi:DNA ligase 1
MPPKQSNTPSPTKKRKLDSTPVKRGVDFFFKKQVERNQAPATNGREEKLFVESDGEGEDIRRRRQEEEDEVFARSLQELEGRQEVDDEEFARRLAKDYEDEHINGGHPEVDGIDDEEDIYGEPPPKLPSEDTTKQPSLPPKFAPADPQSPKLILDPTTLDQIYSIPLDKDPLNFNPQTDAPIASTWFPNLTPYAFLTHSFILINSTRSRLKIVDYLVNTLRVIISHDPASLLPLVWLTTNAIAPPFEGIELNLGGSVISKALVSASGLTAGALKGLYDKWGDVGDVAFEAKMALRTLVAPAPLTVSGVYATLRSIARAKGQGSAETKRRLVERLLVSAKGEEVRYIGRTLVQHVLSLRDEIDKVTYWRC